MPRGEDILGSGGYPSADETRAYPHGAPQADVPTTPVPEDPTTYIGARHQTPAQRAQAPADPSLYQWRPAQQGTPGAYPDAAGAYPEAAPAVPRPGDTMVAGGQARTQFRPQAQAASPYPQQAPQGYPQQAPQGYPQQAGQPYAQAAGQPYAQAPYQAGYPAGRQVPGQDPRYVRPVPSPAPVEAPRQEAYDPHAHERQGHSSAGRAGGRALSLLLSVLSVACRLVAIGLALLVVANAVVTGPLRMHLFEITARVTSWIPGALSGSFVYETPLGGNLRGDFVIVSIVLFVIDWLLARKARDLRR